MTDGGVRGARKSAAGENTAHAIALAGGSTSVGARSCGASSVGDVRTATGGDRHLHRAAAAPVCLLLRWGFRERPRVGGVSAFFVVAGRSAGKVVAGAVTHRLSAGDELVLHRFIRSHALLGVPTQTPGNKVQERFVVAFQGVLEGLRARTTPTALG